MPQADCQAVRVAVLPWTGNHSPMCTFTLTCMHKDSFMNSEFCEVLTSISWKRMSEVGQKAAQGNKQAWPRRLKSGRLTPNTFQHVTVHSFTLQMGPTTPRQWPRKQLSFPDSRHPATFQATGARPCALLPTTATQLPQLCTSPAVVSKPVPPPTRKPARCSSEVCCKCLHKGCTHMPAVLGTGGGTRHVSVHIPARASPHLLKLCGHTPHPHTPPRVVSESVCNFLTGGMSAPHPHTHLDLP